jgi:hypothetical protein
VKSKTIDPAVITPILKSAVESDDHWRLKLEAIKKLRRRGYNLIAMEVAPSGSYDGIADVLGVNISKKRVAVVEVKVGRPDFLRDVNARKRYDAACERHQKRVQEWGKKCEANYRTAGKKPRRPHQPAFKLTSVNYIKSMTEAYIMAPRGLVTKDEIPEGWGLMCPDRILKRAPERTVHGNAVKYMTEAIIRKQTNVYLYNLLGMRWERGGVKLGILGE